MSPDVSVALLHDQMVDKQGKLVTTSITMIDVHDIARSARTYGAKQVFISHPSAAMRRIVRTLKQHWEEGFGADYNPNRKEALEQVRLVPDLDEAIREIDARTGALPQIVATSARPGGTRITFVEGRRLLRSSTTPYLILFGTGWGMCPELLARAQLFLSQFLVLERIITSQCDRPVRLSWTGYFPRKITEAIQRLARKWGHNRSSVEEITWHLEQAACSKCRETLEIR